MDPWRDIWTQPRASIQTLVTRDPSYGFKRLSWIYGVTVALSLSKMFSLVTLYPLWAILLGSLLIGIVFGFISITVTAYILQWCGRLIGGSAPFKHVRCVVAWSNVPMLINVLVWILLICVFRERAFYSDFPAEVTVQNKTGLFFLAVLGQWVASIWSFIILVQGLREVQGFSLWKGLLNILIPIIALLLLSVLMSGAINWFVTKTQ